MDDSSQTDLAAKAEGDTLKRKAISARRIKRAIIVFGITGLFIWALIARSRPIRENPFDPSLIPSLAEPPAKGWVVVDGMKLNEFRQVYGEPASTKKASPNGIFAYWGVTEEGMHRLRVEFDRNGQMRSWKTRDYHGAITGNAIIIGGKSVKTEIAIDDMFED